MDNYFKNCFICQEVVLLDEEAFLVPVLKRQNSVAANDVTVYMVALKPKSSEVFAKRARMGINKCEATSVKLRKLHCITTE